MNNRQRLISARILKTLTQERTQSVYLMEQITPIYKWVSTRFPEHQIFGSEYLGPDYSSGAVVSGIRHENVEALSFASEGFDLIVSNDVLEYVASPIRALTQCYRVLKPTGEMLITIPFHHENDVSITRSTLKNNELKHELPPTYHGNPVSHEGSLVFTDFGWDFLEIARKIGFSSAVAEVYSSSDFGHFGGAQLVFALRK